MGRKACDELVLAQIVARATAQLSREQYAIDLLSH